MKKFWIVLGCMLLAAGCSGESGKKETEQEKDAAPVVKTEEKDDIRDVSFVAVGDNLINRCHPAQKNFSPGFKHGQKPLCQIGKRIHSHTPFNTIAIIFLRPAGTSCFVYN